MSSGLPKAKPGCVGAQPRLEKQLPLAGINNETLQLLTEPHYSKGACGFSLTSPMHLRSACHVCSHLLGKLRGLAACFGFE